MLELLLIIPLFLAFMMGAALLAKLTLVRLELIHLSREVALGLGRSQADEPDATALARALSERSGVLAPASLTAQTSPALGSDWELSSSMTMPDLAKQVLGPLLESTMGTRLTLRYTLAAPRLARKAFPKGFTFEESVAFKSDPWKDPKGRLKRLLSLSNHASQYLFKKDD